MTVKEIAEKLGYTRAKKLKTKYKEYEVYECILEGSEEQYIGYPVYILVKDGKFKISDTKTALEIMGKESD